MQELNNLLEGFYYMFCDGCKFFFAIRVASDIIKSSANADYAYTIKSIMNGTIGFAGLYLIVNILDQVAASFGR